VKNDEKSHPSEKKINESLLKIETQDSQKSQANLEQAGGESKNDLWIGSNSLKDLLQFQFRSNSSLTPNVNNYFLQY